MLNANFKLVKKEINTKSAKYQYEIVEIATGKVVGTRKSDREYVACTVPGVNFFGRVDLAQKHLAKATMHNSDPKNSKWQMITEIAYV